MKIIKCNACKSKKYIRDDEEPKFCPYCRSTFIISYKNEKQISIDDMNKLNKENGNEKEEKMPKESKMGVRVANAAKVIELIKSLSEDENERRKISGRVYNSFKGVTKNE